MENRRLLERREMERREAPRVAVDIWLEEHHGEDVSFRRTGDLSAGGVHLDRGFPKPVGTRVRLRFDLPGETHSIQVVGEVVSAEVNDHELSTRLKFVDLSAEDRARIELFAETVHLRENGEE